MYRNNNFLNMEPTDTDLLSLLDFKDNDGGVGKALLADPGPLMLVIDGDDAINDVIFAGAGDDTVNGLGGNDRLHGQGGTNTLNGGEGNDFLYGSDGVDAMNGGNGIDAAMYVTATAAVTAYLMANLPNAGQAAGDTYTDVENLYGSQFTDVLGGTNDANRIHGREGNDEIYGYDGDDILLGNDGNDFIYGGDGNDRLYGGDGFDFIDGGAGDDRIFGGGGSEELLVGGAGNDIIHIGTGFSRVLAGDGNDTVIGTNLDHIIELGAGNDTYIDGTGGTGTIDGGPGNDRFFDAGGDDYYEGGTGIDSVYFTSATSGISTDSNIYNNVERFFGSYHGDIFNGDDAENFFSGLSGDDVFNGFGGNDKIYGGGGEDILNGGTGDDILNGQADADTYVFTGNNFGADRIFQWEDGIDLIDLSGLGIETDAELTITNPGNHTLIEFVNASITGTITVINTGAGVITADDFIFAQNAEDIGDKSKADFADFDMPVSEMDAAMTAFDAVDAFTADTGESTEWAFADGFVDAFDAA